MCCQTSGNISEFMQCATPVTRSRFEEVMRIRRSCIKLAKNVNRQVVPSAPQVVRSGESIFSVGSASSLGHAKE